MKVNLSDYDLGIEDIEVEDHDIWSADVTLSKIIHPVLVKFKENLQSYPDVDIEDLPTSFEGTDEEKWAFILDKMILAFSRIRDDSFSDQYVSGEADIFWKPLDVDLKETSEEDAKWFEMKEGPNHTLTIDYEKMEADNKETAEGLRLFGKYFTHLWL